MGISHFRETNHVITVLGLQPHDTAQPLGRGGEQKIEFNHRGNHSINFVFVMPP